MIKKLTLFLILCIAIAPSASYAQDETEDLTDYKTACLAAIDNISLIGNSFSMNSMITVAKTTLNLCQTKDAMQRTMTALRAGVLGYLQTTQTFQDGQSFTGLVGNHSFDTGDLSLWYSVTFDLSQVGLSDIVSAMSGGDVSGLVNAVSLNEWNEDTKAVENTGAAAIQGGDKKFYLNSSQLMMQPILGLKAGIYSFSGQVACNPGLLRMNKVHLNALVVSGSAVQEILGDIIGDNANWEEIFNNLDLTQYMGTFLESGKLYTESATCQGLSTFSDGELRFIIDEGDIVIIGINAGMIPFVGTETFRADNLQLTGLKAADQILTPAKADLAAALEGLSEIEANYNAELEEGSAQPAFSYDRTLTENYNQAYRTAMEKYTDDKLTDILSKDNLSNPDGIDAAVKNHYSKDIQTLNNAKEAFDRKAFIVPKKDESFNIVMKDDWISLLSPKWTGNAVTLDGDMTLRFSHQPGQTLFTLAFGFERVSDEYANLLHAFVDDSRNKYYLAETDSGLILTTDSSQAVTITAVPSYTEEGEIHLMAGDMYLGTSSSDNTLITTGEGTLLRPVRTGLSVVPASEMEITVSVPAGQDAGTLILPFDAELPEGVCAYAATGIETMGNGEQAVAYLAHSASSVVRANIPYIIMAAQGDYTFCGVPHAVQPSYAEGPLVGRYTPYTTQGNDEYTLTAGDGLCMFCRTDGQPVAENECYLKCDAPADTIYVSQADAATGICLNSPTALRDERGCTYDLSGRQINSQQQKGIIIRNGKKMMVR
ncbi:MAG: hypothetical protein J6W52_02865 [Bacteroidaceae bacterium]|nr:hypothetical protein [Bacteroidaceae bacterium]